MNIKETTKEFLAFILNENGERADIGKLISALDMLAYSTSFIDFKFDDTEYLEPPEVSYQVIRSKVEKIFPSLGFYNTPDKIARDLNNRKMNCSDSLDDLTDIILDITETLWRFENTSNSDALWYFESSYIAHWGMHLRRLQVYLHDKSSN